MYTDISLKCTLWWAFKESFVTVSSFFSFSFSWNSSSKPLINTSKQECTCTMLFTGWMCKRNLIINNSDSCWQLCKGKDPQNKTLFQENDDWMCMCTLTGAHVSQPVFFAHQSLNINLVFQLHLFPSPYLKKKVVWIVRDSWP